MQVDIIHLEEELESMGASEQRSLESNLTQLIMHLLKLKYQKKLYPYKKLDSLCQISA